jgi:hypothetical protein
LKWLNHNTLYTEWQCSEKCRPLNVKNTAASKEKEFAIANSRSSKVENLIHQKYLKVGQNIKNNVLNCLYGITHIIKNHLRVYQW